MFVGSYIAGVVLSVWARYFDIFHVSHVPRHGISANVRTSVLSSTLVFCLCIHLQEFKVSALWRGANFVLHF